MNDFMENLAVTNDSAERSMKVTTDYSAVEREGEMRARDVTVTCAHCLQAPSLSKKVYSLDSEHV